MLRPAAFWAPPETRHGTGDLVIAGSLIDGLSLALCDDLHMLSLLGMLMRPK
jgi:hypothetical protein